MYDANTSLSLQAKRPIAPCKDLSSLNLTLISKDPVFKIISSLSAIFAIRANDSLPNKTSEEFLSSYLYKTVPLYDLISSIKIYTLQKGF